MKKILALSILVTVLSSCSHFGKSKHAGCSCEKGKPCSTGCADTKAEKDGKPTECDDCKKAK